MTRYQLTASDWHGGQCSALYSFASTGRVWSAEHRRKLKAEIADCLTEAELAERRKLTELMGFVSRARVQR